jgi:hypothetical protein
MYFPSVKAPANPPRALSKYCFYGDIQTGLLSQRSPTHKQPMPLLSLNYADKPFFLLDTFQITKTTTMNITDEIAAIIATERC